MAPFRLADPASIPLDQLFPEHYEASKREIARDFLFFGSAIVLSIVLAATIHLALA